MTSGYLSSGPILAPAAIAMLGKLNRDFLDLLVTEGEYEGAFLPGRVMEVLATVSPAQRDMIAACPYALFVLKFPEEPGVFPTDLPEVNDPARERYGMPADKGGAWPAFITAAWFFAWHLSRSRPLSVQVMLGLPMPVTQQLAGLHPWQLPHLTRRQPQPLQVRWQANPCFWLDLIRFADEENPLRLTAARLLGVQLLAAELRPPAGAARHLK